MSSGVAPSASSPLISRSRETEASATSILATRDWLEPSLRATARHTCCPRPATAGNDFQSPVDNPCNQPLLFGQLLETFVLQELVRLGGWAEEPVRFSHYRDRDGVELDVVLESERSVVGVEVKAGATVTQRDLRGLRSLSAAAGEAWAGGAVVNDGEATVPFGDRLWAVPSARLWEQ